jgi:hypothetical protein
VTRPVSASDSPGVQDGEQAALSLEHVEAVIRLAEYRRKEQRRATFRRRLRKAGLIAVMPIAGPLAGSVWAEQEQKGWR